MQPENQKSDGALRRRLRAWQISATVATLFALTLLAIVTYSQTEREPKSVSTVFRTWVSDHLLNPALETLPHSVILIVALWLGYRELKLHRELDRFRLAFEKEKFEDEKRQRESNSKYREQERQRFSEPAKEVAELIADNLKEHPHWARQALEEARLLPYSDTLFGDRSKHFGEEKRELAALFTPYLLKRCQYIIESLKKDVFLLIDSGTTLHLVFEIIGRETARAWDRRDEWLQRFHLATNNLPGIEQLIKNGRKSPLDRYSRLAIDHCILLPGVPIPIFAAVAGPSTTKAIRSLKTEHPDARFISLVVGNWIRVRRSTPPCPIPMARDSMHLDVKQALIDVADETFVVSPLGKVFVYTGTQEVNKMLIFDSTAATTSLDDKAPYVEVVIDDQKAKTVKLIATAREDRRKLYAHSVRVFTALNQQPQQPIAEDEFSKTVISDVPHIMFPFDKLPVSKGEEFVVEFPHQPTRTNRELLKNFCVQAP